MRGGSEEPPQKEEGQERINLEAPRFKERKELDVDKRCKYSNMVLDFVLNMWFVLYTESRLENAYNCLNFRECPCLLFI